MQRFFDLLLSADSPDMLTRLLTAWRLWLAGAVLGAAIAAGIYNLAPPPFQAQATVLVDQNIEEAWTYYPDRQLFYYVERETRKLEELAWSDSTLQIVADEAGVTISQLRNTFLYLEQPREAGWHFWAQDTDAQRAAELASSWARAFVDQVQNNLAVSEDLETARQELEDYLLANPRPDEREVNALTVQLGDALEAVPGISPYVQLQLTQEAELPTSRTISQGTYLFIGSVMGVVSMALLGLFVAPKFYAASQDD